MALTARTGGLTHTTWDATMSTQTGYLTRIVSSRFVDEFNSAGYGEAIVPMDSPDAGILLRDTVVKVHYGDAVRFAWFVESIDRSLVDSDGRRLIKASGRGILAWLDDAVVYPQRGLANYNTPQRGYDFRAEGGSWVTASSSFSAPVGVAWKDDNTAREKAPRGWPDKDAQWIWATSPTAAVDEGAVNWFRSTFTLSSSSKVRFWATADNAFDLYVDGLLLLSSADQSSSGATWTQMRKRTLRLPAGTHQLAARVENGKPTTFEDVSVATDDKVSLTGHGLANGVRLAVTRIADSGTGLSEANYYVVNRTDDDFKLSTTDGGSAVNVTKATRIDFKLLRDSSAGFLMTSSLVNENNKPTGGVLRRTNQAAWTVASAEPAWFPATIVWDAITEAKARGVTRLEGVTRDFTNTADSASASWTTKVATEVKVGTSVLGVLDQCVDYGVDFWMRPTDGTLFAWESRGTDLSASIRLQPGHGLLKYTTTVDPRVKTVALVRSKDGWGQERRNDTGALGRRETYIEVGTAKSINTAKTVAGRMLRRLGRQVVTASTVEAIPVGQAVPYVGFTVGDVISIPEPTGAGWVRARVLSLSLIDQGGVVTYQPELEVLP